MFTGIIEERGKLLDMSPKGQGFLLKIGCEKVLEDAKVGDSIATNGVCLTISSLGKDFYTADVMKQTLTMTGFSGLKKGDMLNLERALQPSSRLGGHFVSGHIDGVGTVRKISSSVNNTIIEIETDKDIVKYIIPQGSVAIDGISLTVADVLSDSTFTCSIIPTTLKETGISEYKIGTVVNLETDMLGKYVYNFLNKNKKNDGGLTMEKLLENGFI